MRKWPPVCKRYSKVFVIQLVLRFASCLHHSRLRQSSLRSKNSLLSTHMTTYQTEPFNKTSDQPRKLTAPLPQPAPIPVAASVMEPGDESNEKRDLRQKLVQSLKFDQLGARSMNIEATYGNTCQWFLSKQEYVDWQKPGRHSPSSWFLWIKGKPGTGKSTLMKYLHSTRHCRGSTNILLSFFFNARGAYLEKSTIGCYRGLLFALLDGRDNLWPSLDHLGNTGSEYILKDNWTVASLTQTLTRAIQMAQSQAIEIWIDALDECEEDEVRKMVSFFEDLADLADSQDIDLKICFASRHYPSVTSRKGIDVILELQHNHDEDIARYIEAKLYVGAAQAEIKAELLRKYSGIFLWVVLVVHMLNREYARGNVLALRKRLDEIPADLHAVFEKVLANDEGDNEELVLLFQLVLRAEQALEPAELFVAIQRAKEPQGPLQRWDRNKPPMSPEALQRWVNSSSRGLAQVTRPSKVYPYYWWYNANKPTVQFIHESVRDYLLGKSGNKYTWSGLSKLGDAYQVWAKVCLDHILAVDISINDDLLDVLRYPLTAYAVAYLRQHTMRAIPNRSTEQEETERGYVLAKTYFRPLCSTERLEYREYVLANTYYRTLSVERIDYLERSIQAMHQSEETLQSAVDMGETEGGLSIFNNEWVYSRTELQAGFRFTKVTRARGEIWAYLKNTSEDPDVVIRRLINNELPNTCTSEDSDVLLRHCQDIEQLFLLPEIFPLEQEKRFWTD